MKSRVAENKEKQAEIIEMELLSTLGGEFFPDDFDYDSPDYSGLEEGEPLDGADLVQYEEAIRERVDKENQVDETAGNPCNLMAYFAGSDAVKRKVESAVVSVKNIDDVLYGCVTLKIKEPLDETEWSEMKEYIEGQYSDGWGEGFEQREIPVDEGRIYVKFWQFDGFHFLNKEELQMCKTTVERKKRPKLKLLGHDGNIFSILGDARKLLKQNGQAKEAEEMFDRVMKYDNYYQALGIISEYVETELSPPVQKTEQKEKHRRDGDCR